MDVHRIAKKHKVKLETVHSWKAKGWSRLQLLVGKADPILAAVDDLLEKQALAAPPKNSGYITRKPNERQLKVPKPPANDWNPTPEEVEHYHETGEQLDSRYNEKFAEYKAIVDWLERYNTGNISPG